jgi:hypothetical protein
MRWIRSNIRALTHLALFALALQTALTFGHVHLAGLASSQMAAAAVADRSAAPPVKPQQESPKPQKSADFDCPVCALIQLAGTSAPSVAPALPLPVVRAGLPLETSAQTIAAPAPQLAFQARGPPTV